MIVFIDEQNNSLAALQALLSAFGQGRGPAAEPIIPTPAAPPGNVTMRRQIQAGKRKAKIVLPVPGAVAADVPAAVTFAGCVRAAVREAPRTNAEIRDYVNSHGFPEADSSKTSIALCGLRTAGEIFKTEDLKWKFATGR
jgi:hypothetical protein